MTYERANGLRYLFIDFNAFFAAVEQHDDEALRSRPVIVIPQASEHTGAIAVSYEARAFGVRRGMKVRDVIALCPQIAIRVARHDRYVAIHASIMRTLDRYLPVAKVYSIDEAAFRLSRREAAPEAALAIAGQMRLGLAADFSPALRASIGLAQTRLLAKLAAELKKPDGLTVLRPQDLPDRLVDITLTDIPGIGGGVAARLARSGVVNFLDLWRLEPKRARRIWGSVQGERFWYALHGYEVDEPAEKKSMIGHSRVLTRDHQGADQARIVARALLLKAASRLRHYRLHAASLSLNVRLRPEGNWDGVRKFPPSQDSFDFLSALDDMWRGLIRDGMRDGAAPCCGVVTVYLHSLVRADDPSLSQSDLFADRAAHEKSEAGAKLWATVDAINSDPTGKFRRLGAAGRNVAAAGPPKRHVMLARQQGLDLNYLGAKIAFSRVPTEAEFLY